MSIYNPAARLLALGLPAAASAVAGNNELFLQTKRGDFCVYRAASALHVLNGPNGEPLIKLGQPLEGGLVFGRDEIIRATAGTPQDPGAPGMLWERFRDSA